MGYLSLKDYAVIGDKCSAALVSRLGSIDWCCLPYLDSPSHFAALLDENRGGSFKIAPSSEYHSEQKYLQRTNVVETLFETPTGRAILTDWMSADDHMHSNAPVIYRRLDLIDGQIEFALNCVPKFNYGSETAQAAKFRDSILFRGNAPGDIAFLHSDLPIEVYRNRGAHYRFSLSLGQSATFAWVWGRHKNVSLDVTPKKTIEYWQKQSHRCQDTLSELPACLFAGPWHDLVSRSGLLVNLMLNDFSGSLAESPTTSLPALKGGGKNWDYRHAWLRDAAMTIQALLNIGQKDAAQKFFHWLADRILQDGAEALQTVYTLDGGKNLPERELMFLTGYAGSRPVRIGNLAARQFQLDIFGHVMLASSHYLTVFKQLPANLWPKLAEITDYICHIWRRPDHGHWENRSKPEHFVISKVMCWVAIDQACKMAAKLGLQTPPRWLHERKILHKTVCEQGYDTKQRAFVRTFGDQELDSTNLLLPLLGFLPINDERIQGTIDATQRSLSNGVFLYRFTNQDKLPESDSVHPQSSFWLVSCLALAGRHEEASDHLAELCTYATPLGLFGEYLDPISSEPAGNFPSSSTHLALINASIYVGICNDPQKMSCLTFPIIGFNPPEP